MVRAPRLGAALLFLASITGVAFTDACKSSSTGTGGSGPSCTAGKQECVDDTVARVCPADGGGWIAVPCGQNEKCTAGVCAVDPTITACMKGARDCVDTRTARVCAPDASAWVTVSCAENELCTAGACALDPKALACTAGKADCVDPTIGRICAPDGSAWVPFTCAQGQRCDTGKCVFDTTMMCTPGTGTCVAGNPMLCKADGSGYDATPCPTGSTCDAGHCKGSVCVIGDSQCDNNGFLQTCPKGTEVELTPCPLGQSCINPADVGVFGQPASCQPFACTPYSTVCGNPLDPNADPTKTYSACVETATGWAWQAIQCDTFSTCQLTNGYAQCSFQCQPGDTTCAADGSGILTCGADAKYAPVPTTTCAAGSTCLTTQGGTLSCGNAACGNGVPGACTANGNIRLCDATGALAATATPCAVGVCTGSGVCKAQCTDGQSQCKTMPDGSTGVVLCVGGIWQSALSTQCSTPVDPTKACIPLKPGLAVCGDAACAAASGVCTANGLLQACDANGNLTPAGQAVACPAGQLCNSGACVAAPCAAGESKCMFGNSMVTCDNGQWSPALTFCGAAADGGLSACLDGVVGGLRTAVCGAVCTPGERQCITVDGGSSTSLHTCGSDGQWGAAEACVIGSCTAVVKNVPAPGSGTIRADACEAQCVPGQPVCGGSQVIVAGTTMMGYGSAGICTAGGALPSMSACGAGTACRTDDKMNAYGCVQCVGNRNEYGYTDTMCTTAPAASGVVVCGASNTWDVAAPVSCNGAACIAPAAASYSPAHCGGSCGSCLASSLTGSCSAQQATCATKGDCVVYEKCVSTCTTTTCISNCYPNPFNVDSYYLWSCQYYGSCTYGSGGSPAACP